MRATNFTDTRHSMHAIWPQRHTRTPAVAAAGDHRTWAVELVSVAVMLLVLLAWCQHDGRTTAVTNLSHGGQGNSVCAPRRGPSPLRLWKKQCHGWQHWSRKGGASFPPPAAGLVLDTLLLDTPCSTLPSPQVFSLSQLLSRLDTLSHSLSHPRRWNPHCRGWTP